MRFRYAFSFATLLAAGACEIPTDVPLVQQRWILPMEEVTLEQAELLPNGVTISANLYDVTIDTARASASLMTLCSVCVSSGVPIPVPAYVGQFTSVDNLPSDVLSAEVESGSVAVTISNDLSFDPIAGGGSMTITVRSAGGGPALGTLVLQSPADALAPASVTTRTLTLAAGTVTGAIETRVDVDSPGGQIATINITDAMSMEAVTSSFLVREATVNVDGLSASLSEEALDAQDLDETITDGIVNGSVVLDVTNPFGLTFSGTIRVGTVIKSVLIPATPTSTVEVSYTGDELRSFLGVPGVTLSGDGTIGGGPATISAGLDFIIDPTIDLIIELGG